MKKYKGVLPVYPEGWYVVCLAKELENNTVVSKNFCGNEVVVFRTKAGKVGIIDAYCKHMGAHLGKGGVVEGETIKCPFHGFCFDIEGECTQTSYGTPPSPRVHTTNYHYKEIHDVIMAYFHPQSITPSWYIPDLDMHDWTPLIFKEWQLKSHPQETAENAVDVGHFAEVHSYESVETTEAMKIEGPVLTASYKAVRPAGLGKKPGGKPVHVEFKIAKYGFGYSVVEAYVENLGITMRHFVFTCPTDGEYISFRIALSVKKISNKMKINPLTFFLPEKLLRHIILKFTFQSYQHDVSQDFDIWQNKTYIHPPALSKGDGPIMEYRKWAEQFYTAISN
jgi:phenylpropionate dioxygenase-like ring-hydroxylating dioxygenase large terminal subunit